MNKFLLLLFLFPFLLFSQQKKIDSLRKVYKNKSQSDTNRMKAGHEIAWSYLNNNPDTAIGLAEQTLQFAKARNQKKHQGIAFFTLGTAYMNLGNFPKALEHYEKYSKICEETNNKKGLGESYLNIGNVYEVQLNYVKVLEYSFKALKINQEIGNKQGLGDCFKQIARVYQNQSNYPKALEYYLKTLNLFQEINDKKGIGKTLNHIGQLYIEQFNHAKALEYFLKFLKNSEKIGDKESIGNAFTNIGIVYYEQLNYSKALEYQLKALKIFEEIGDKQNLGYCYNNIGNVYDDQSNYKKALENYQMGLKIHEDIVDKYGMAAAFGNIAVVYSKQSNYSKALEYFLKALKINEELGDKSRIASNYINLGVMFNNLLDFKKAILYSDSGLQISKEIGDIDNERLSYGNIAISFSKTGRYKEAYENQVKFKQLTDSIFNVENSKQLGDMKTNFEVEKKETELKLKAEAEKEKIAAVTKEEKKRQQIIIYSVAGILILVMIFAGFMVNRFRVTSKQKKIIEIKEQETQKQNEIISHQKHLVEEKHLEITDSINYAERIQRAMLASGRLLDANLFSPWGDAEGRGGYFVFFKPKDVVSGDFYWASCVSSKAETSAANRVPHIASAVAQGLTNKFCLVTADSTGHGVPGAIMSMLNMNSLKEAITKGLTEADDILNYTRSIVINTLANDGSKDGGKDGMDCSLLIFDHQNMTLDWVAANNPVWIVRKVTADQLAVTSSAVEKQHEGLDCARPDNKEILELKPQKMPVGRHERQNEPFVKQTFQLQKGDVIYAIIDGFPDQFGGEKGKKFMSKNLKELLKNNAHLSMPKQKILLETTFKNWVGDLEQVDDVTIIGVRV